LVVLFEQIVSYGVNYTDGTA